MKAFFTTVAGLACLLASAQTADDNTPAEDAVAQPQSDGANFFPADAENAPVGVQGDFPPPPGYFPQNPGGFAPPPFPSERGTAGAEAAPNPGKKEVAKDVQGAEDGKAAEENTEEAVEEEAPPDEPKKRDLPRIEKVDTTKFPQELQNLFKRNPFGASIGYGRGADGRESHAPKNLNLHSIYSVDGKWYFDIRDASLKKSYTVTLGGKTDASTPYAVDFYDEETNSVSVTSDLSSFVMTLKTPDPPTRAVAPQKNSKTRTGRR